MKVVELLDGEGLDPGRGAGLHAADELYGGRRGFAGMHGVGTFGGVGTVLGVGVGAESFAVEDDQGSVGERAHGGGIPAGGDEAFHAAARFGDIHDGGGVGIGAGDEEAFAIGAEAEGGRGHAQGLARGHGDVDALHQVDVLGGSDAEGEHVIGIGGGDEDARGVGRRFAGGGFRRAVAPQHIAGMGADAHGLPDQAAAGGIVLAERAIGPVGDEEGFAIGVEENAVGTAAGFELADHHAGLRVDHRDAIAIEVGGIEQAAVGRKGHVADEILRAALGLRHDDEGPRGGEDAVGEGEFEDGGFGASAHIDGVAFGRDGEAQPAIGHGNAAGDAAGGGFDHADRRRAVSSVEHQQVFAVGREGGGHGESVQRDLAADRVQAPAAIEQEAAAGERSDLFAGRRLRAQDGDQREKGDGQGHAIFQRTWRVFHGQLSLYGNSGVGFAERDVL